METIEIEKLSEDAIRSSYIDIKRRVATLAGVQTNIRMRVFANPVPLLHSIINRAYTRTIRLGELIESELFARVWRDAPLERKPDGPLLLKRLKIHPTAAGESFDPKIHSSNGRFEVTRVEAFVYIRQSTTDRVLNNHESRRRQYGLAERARQRR
ncbi:MAG: hypothetical protein WA624_12170 [Methylocella sp.]